MYIHIKTAVWEVLWTAFSTRDLEAWQSVTSVRTHCVRPTPDNKYLCAVDNGIDQVKIYRINKKKDKLELVDILRRPRESGLVSSVSVMTEDLHIFF